MDTVIWIEQDAPPKPRIGEECNGCGVCCSVAPCPVGMLLSLRTSGRCAALQWTAATGRYACGALTATAHTRWPATWLHAWLRRRIAAGVGCDCAVDAVRPHEP